MSTEDDNDIALKDQLMQRLEENGALAALRAQLRATVFLALEEKSGNKAKFPVSNDTVRKLMGSSAGKQCGAIVLDFLECLKLTATLSVYTKEIGLDLSSELENKPLKELRRDESEPILLELLNRSSKSRSATPPLSSINMKQEMGLFRKSENNLTPPTTAKNDAKSQEIEESNLETKNEKEEESPKNNSATTKELKTSSAGVETISSDSIDNDFFDEIPAAPGSNWLSKKTTGTPEPPKFVEPEPKNKQISSGGDTGSSLLGALPQLPGRSLPPLGSVTNKADSDFMKLLTDSLENIDSGTDEDSSTANGSSKAIPKQLPAVAKLEKQIPVHETFAAPGKQEKEKPNKAPVSDFFKKTLSTENDASSISEEIVEDLEVDDLLDSGRSEKQISF